MIAIHTRPGTFSERWIHYCKSKGIKYKLVDCYADDILNQLEGCDRLMWHWPHYEIEGSIIAKPLTYLFETIGIKVFPSFSTAWSYDDKLAQKYIFEALDIPHIPTRVFFDQDTALAYARSTSYPKVFKLSRGAGSTNVQLLHNYQEAKRAIRRSFSSGWSDRAQARRWALNNRLANFRRDRDFSSLLRISFGVFRYLFPLQEKGKSRIEKAYVYLQDFLPNNDFDIRVVVIGKKAFAIKRIVRTGDFRASGSGNIVYDVNEIPVSCVRIAFETNRKLGANCLAYDFVFEVDGTPRVIEISYAFSQDSYLKCPGYWDEKLTWHDTQVIPEHMMMEAFLEE